MDKPEPEIEESKMIGIDDVLGVSDFAQDQVLPNVQKGSRLSFSDQVMNQISNKNALSTIMEQTQDSKSKENDITPRKSDQFKPASDP